MVIYSYLNKWNPLAAIQCLFSYHFDIFSVYETNLNRLEKNNAVIHNLKFFIFSNFIKWKF